MLESLPLDLRKELAARLKGPELLLYCKGRPQCNDKFWGQKIFQDFNVESQGRTRADYHAYMVGQAFGVDLHDDPRDISWSILFKTEGWAGLSPRREGLLNLAMSNPNIASFIITYGTSQLIFDYIWDSYPALQKYLVFSVLLLQEKNLLKDRDMYISAQELFYWKRSFSSNMDFNEKLNEILGTMIHV